MRNSPILGSVFALLFALPFFGAGIAMLTLGWMEFIQSHRASTTWKPAAAQIVDAQIETQRGSKGGSTWRAVGSFTYEFNGEKYTSSRLNFGTGSDNVGTYHQDLVNRMQDARTRQSPMTCRVNPEHPSEAVLDPDWRPEMFLFMSVMGATFGGVGLGMGLFAILGLKNGIVARLASGGGAQGERGRWDERGSNVLRPAVSPGTIGAGITLPLVHAATLPLWTKLGGLAHSSTGIAIIATLSLLGTVTATFFCATKLAQWLRFRSARLELDRIPATPGKPFRARLVLPGGAPAGRAVDMALRCIERITTRSGKNSSQAEHERWQQSLTSTGHLDPRLPIVFACDIPEGLPETTAPGLGDGIRWRFEVKAGSRIFGLRLHFNIPVFRTV